MQMVRKKAPLAILLSQAQWLRKGRKKNKKRRKRQSDRGMHRQRQALVLARTQHKVGKGGRYQKSDLDNGASPAWTGLRLGWGGVDESNMWQTGEQFQEKKVVRRTHLDSPAMTTNQASPSIESKRIRASSTKARKFIKKIREREGDSPRRTRGDRNSVPVETNPPVACVRRSLSNEKVDTRKAKEAD